VRVDVRKPGRNGNRSVVRADNREGARDAGGDDLLKTSGAPRGVVGPAASSDERSEEDAG
jgi:hypothetical protein